MQEVKEVDKLTKEHLIKTFEEAKTDWHTNTYTLPELRRRYGGIVFANPK